MLFMNIKIVFCDEVVTLIMKEFYIIKKNIDLDWHGIDF